MGMPQSAINDGTLSATRPKKGNAAIKTKKIKPANTKTNLRSLSIINI